MIYYSIICYFNEVDVKNNNILTKDNMKRSSGIYESIILIGLFYILWKFGLLDANFEKILMLATFICGIGFIAEKAYFKKKRQQIAKEYEVKETQENNELKTNGVNREEIIKEKTKEILEQPKYLEWTAGLFPVLIIIFIVRSFIVEPFNIPSGSMMPTLIEGDNILVKKYEYGLRVPVFNTQITEGNKVKRGDIIVFHYPMEPNIKYIKRAIGLPGDTIEYKNKELFVNGEKINRTQMENYKYPRINKTTLQFKEKLGDVEHQILIEPEASGTVTRLLKDDFLKNCKYDEDYIKCVIPEKSYYMMGDNRDASLDSRYWGFVPEENLVGKAVAIWSNFSDMSRVGSIK